MKCLLSVSLLALTLVVIARIEDARSAQAMQKGVSVKLAATKDATPMPDADNEDAWIVTVTESGSLYFGVHPVTLDSLDQEMKERPRNRRQQLYIKADSRAPFANVEEALEAGRTVFFGAAVLLTQQPESSKQGNIVPPKGLEVLLDQSEAGSESVTVQVVGSGPQPPTLKINNRKIPITELQSALTQIFQNQNQRLVTLKANGSLPFTDVAHVIDVCHAAGVKTALLMPAL